MKLPTISIIVPVYNVEEFIRKCLDSILAQTFTDWECILVDDGSSDNSGDICDEYAQRDARFIVIHKENEGIAKARITAYNYSKGELITFIDSDDYVLPEYLELLAKPIIEDDVDMVSCNYFDEFVDKNQITSSKKVLEGVYINESLNDFIGNHYFYDRTCKGFGMTNMLWTKMVRRNYVQKGLEMGVGLWFGEDQVAVYFMLYHIRKLCLIPNRLYYYVHHKMQTTQRYDLTLWDSLIQMFETYQDIDRMKMSKKGLRIRTWLYIRRTITAKMISNDIDVKTFVRHLTYMKNNHI